MIITRAHGANVNHQNRQGICPLGKVSSAKQRIPIACSNASLKVGGGPVSLDQ